MNRDQRAQLSRRDFLRHAATGAVLLGGGFSIIGCGGGGSAINSGFARSASYEWLNTLLEAITAVKPGPPMTARAIGMVATAAYDAWACYDDVAKGTRLGGSLRRPFLERTIVNKSTAISYAAYRVLVDLYPAQKDRFDAKMASMGLDPLNTSLDTTTAIGIGNKVAQELLAFRHSDGSNQLNNYADTTGYVPVNTPDNVVDPSQWQQLRFANGNSPGFIAPHWGNVVPFALSSPSVLRPPAPPAFGSPTHLDQCQEVITLTANLNDRTKTIAEYWADGPSTVLPPGHWQLFGQVVSDRDRHNLDQDVKLFFLLGNAVFDAGIACWDGKRVYNTSRPITAIRNLFAGQQIMSFAGPNSGMQLRDGAEWHPYQSINFVTPPFPEYTSGHSTFSASSAEILKRFTGSDNFGHSVTVNAGASGFEVGVPSAPVTLSWNTFSDAADEAGMSRLYGGIHFRAGNAEGQHCGRQVGAAVWEVGMAYINGTSA